MTIPENLKTSSGHRYQAIRFSTASIGLSHAASSRHAGLDQHLFAPASVGSHVIVFVDRLPSVARLQLGGAGFPVRGQNGGQQMLGMLMWTQPSTFRPSTRMPGNDGCRNSTACCSDRIEQSGPSGRAQSPRDEPLAGGSSQDDGCLHRPPGEFGVFPRNRQTLKVGRLGARFPRTGCRRARPLCRDGWRMSAADLIHLHVLANLPYAGVAAAAAAVAGLRLPIEVDE